MKGFNGNLTEFLEGFWSRFVDFMLTGGSEQEEHEEQEFDKEAAAQFAQYFLALILDWPLQEMPKEDQNPRSFKAHYLRLKGIHSNSSISKHKLTIIGLDPMQYKVGYRKHLLCYQVSWQFQHSVRGLF